jgi:hypothetical protein
MLSTSGASAEQPTPVARTPAPGGAAPEAAAALAIGRRPDRRATWRATLRKATLRPRSGLRSVIQQRNQRQEKQEREQCDPPRWRHISESWQRRRTGGDSFESCTASGLRTGLAQQCDQRPRTRGKHQGKQGFAAGYKRQRCDDQRNLQRDQQMYSQLCSQPCSQPCKQPCSQSHELTGRM